MIMNRKKKKPQKMELIKSIHLKPTKKNQQSNLPIGFYCFMSFCFFKLFYECISDAVCEQNPKSIFILIDEFLILIQVGAKRIR